MVHESIFPEGKHWFFKLLFHELSLRSSLEMLFLNSSKYLHLRISQLCSLPHPYSSLHPLFPFLHSLLLGVYIFIFKVLFFNIYLYLHPCVCVCGHAGTGVMTSEWSEDNFQAIFQCSGSQPS